jgi:PKD repeat protein
MARLRQKVSTPTRSRRRAPADRWRARAAASGWRSWAPGSVTSPTPGTTITSGTTLTFTPVPGQDITEVDFYGNGGNRLGASSAPEPDGTFSTTVEETQLNGPTDAIYAVVYYADPFGAQHVYVTPSVTVDVPEPEPELNENPQLSVEANPTNGHAPLTTTFTIAASDPDGLPLTYQINFGDGAAEQTSPLPASGTVTLEHTYETPGVQHAQVTVFDSEGRDAETSVPITVAEPEQGAPANTLAPTVTGATRDHETLTEHHGTWTNDPTGYAYKWLRCNAQGGECATIVGATGQTYQLTDSDVGATIEVRETAANSHGASSPATSSHTQTIAASAPLQADAGEEIEAVAGTPVTLDGSGSTPAEAIASYTWQFGDGGSGQGAIVSHTYTQSGTYTATLTVSDGTGRATASTTVHVSPPPAQQAEVEVLDEHGQPLSGAEVMYVTPDGQRTSAVSDSGGTALLANLPDGTDTVYAYSEGFQPAVGQIDVSSGAGHATIQLHSGAVAASTLEDHQMTLSEIEAAGIDTSDPANQNVYEFEVRLAFVESPQQGPVGLSCRIDSDGEFVDVDLCDFGGSGGGGGTGGGGTGGGGGGGGEFVGGACSPSSCQYSNGETSVVAIPKFVEGHPLIEWLILRGKVTVLKQFATVDMTIQNLSDEPFKLADGKATLDLPRGLSLAPTAEAQTLTHAVPDIDGGQSVTTSWVIRGDEPGEYLLSAVYNGQLEPFQAPVETRAALAQPLRIWGAEAFTLSVKADSGKLAPGVPYHVTIGVTNHAEVPFYNVNLSIDSDVHANFVFQPDERFDDTIGELGPGQTLYSHTYVLLPDAASVSVFNPELSSATFDGEEVHPGADIEAVAPPQLYQLTAPADTPGLIHLHWQPVPGAEGYEVFSTPNLDTAFAETPDAASPTPTGTPSTSPIPATDTDAYLSPRGTSPRYYAVTSIVEGRPTL